MARPRFETLDGMRGVAALLVVLFHWSRTVPHGRMPLPSAFLAVDLFFILSGFVLAHRHERQLAAPGGFTEFIKARLLRLYPLALLGVLLGASESLAEAAVPSLEAWKCRVLANELVRGILFIPRITGPRSISPFR